MSLEAAIASQVGSRTPDEVTELVLDTCKSTRVVGLDGFSNLRLLTLNSCGLNTLEGFPTLPKLQRLELSDNSLSDGLEALQEAGLVQLRSLSLAGNKFTSLDELEPLAALPNLRDLDMFNCAVTELADYRAKLFDMFPVLKYLDGYDANGDEKPDEDGDDDDDDDDEGDDDDLLDSEIEPSEGGEDDEESGLEDGEEFGEEFGEEGEEFGEEGEEGDSALEEEEGEGGEEEDETDGGDEGDETGDEESAASDAKRQRR